MLLVAENEGDDGALDSVVTVTEREFTVVGLATLIGAVSPAIGAQLIWAIGQAR